MTKIDYSDTIDKDFKIKFLFWCDKVKKTLIITVKKEWLKRVIRQ